MKHSAAQLARAGAVAALYVTLTAPLSALAYGPLQVRPAEALTILPLFFPETILGLFVGCLLSNLFSGYGFLDVGLGSLTTLIAASCTYLTGLCLRKDFYRILVGGIFPVFLNALILPVIFKLAGDKSAFFVLFYPILITQIIWVYAPAFPIYYLLKSILKNQKNP